MATGRWSRWKERKEQSAGLKAEGRGREIET